MQFAAVLLHDQLDLAGLFVDFALGRNPFDEVFIFDIARAFANNRNVVLFPLGDLCACFDFSAISNKDLCSQFDGEGLKRLNRFGAEELFVLFKRTSFIADDVEASRFY